MGRRLQLFLRVVLVFGLAGIPARSLPVGGMPGSYSTRIYQTRDGLPEETVQAFAQTPDKYLWIGTTGGLLRYDGATFVAFSRENIPAFHENSVWCLTPSRDGSLWIGTDGGGLVHYAGGVFRNYSEKEGLADDFVRAVLEDRQGAIWIGTDAGLFRLVNGKIQRIDGIGDVPAVAVHAIREDDRGRIWIGGSRLIMFDHGTPHEFHLEGDSSQNRVKSILQTKDGTIWVGTVSGLQQMRGDGVFKRVAGVSGTVRVLREASDGLLWIGTIGNGIITTRPNSPLDAASRVDIRSPAVLPSNTVLAVFEDGERNIWVGTQAGMMRFSKTAVRIVPLPGASDSDFGTVYRDRDGSLWVGSTRLFHLRNGVAKPYVFPGMAGVKIRNMLRDRTGALWFGTDGCGLFHLADGQLTHYTTRQGLVNNFVRELLEGRDGSIWIATDEGVSRWRNGGFTNFQVKDGLVYFSTRSMLEDRHGDLWVGTERGLSRIHNDKFTPDPLVSALRQQKVWSIYEDPDGTLWFGTRNNGLYRYRPGKLTHYTTAEGLASNSIYQILADASGHFWLSGPTGISLLNRRELDIFADHPAQRLSLSFYGVSNEVDTTQMYGGTQPAGAITPQGDVWFPTNKGPVHVSLHTSVSSQLPPMVIGMVKADGREVAAAHEISLAPKTGRLDISYAPILLHSQEGVRFKYKLEGFDRDWSEASAERTAHYTNLPAGKFNFHVAAFETNDPNAVSCAAIAVVKTPHLYETWWFWAACLLVIAMGVLAVHRSHVSQLRARFAAVLEERGRLAREMHDTVIQGCTGISAVLEAASSIRLSEANLRQDLIDCARTQIRNTINEAREAVWNLRNRESSAESIAPLLERMTSRLSFESGIRVEYQSTGKAFALDQSTTHEIMMVTREAVCNAILHANPARVLMNVQFGEDDLTLEVIDDGSGFDMATVGALSSGSQNGGSQNGAGANGAGQNGAAQAGGHFGLVGMRERVQRMGGDFSMHSSPGDGTELVIHVPRKKHRPVL